jgi:hypothetical protein
VLLPGVALEPLELVSGLFWPYVDDVFDWPLRSLPLDEVSVDVPLVLEPLVDPGVAVVEPCVATWPWLPAALWVPSTEPCVLVPVLEVFEAVRVSLLGPEHATSSAAAPSAVTKWTFMVASSGRMVRGALVNRAPRVAPARLPDETSR